MDNHVKNKKYGNFVSISSLTGECAAEKFKNFCRSSLWTCLHHMVIFRSQNKITDFLMILAWASSFNLPNHIPSLHRRTYLQKYLCFYEKDNASKGIKLIWSHLLWLIMTLSSWWLIISIAPPYSWNLNHLIIYPLLYQNSIDTYNEMFSHILMLFWQSWKSTFAVTIHLINIPHQYFIILLVLCLTFHMG